MTDAPMTLLYDRGTLLLPGANRAEAEAMFRPGLWTWDARVGALRCDALRYAEVRATLRERRGESYPDKVLRPAPVRWGEMKLPALRPDQEAALAAWRDAKGRGIIVMPTGAGKTLVALAAMARTNRATLVVAPIRDLMHQWRQRILAGLGYDAGVVGDSLHDLRPVTVTTYDSAAIHAEKMGDRFELVIFDEVHHLPGRFYRESALKCAAPYRMGLTATLERADGLHLELADLVGPVAYRQELQQARGKTLADYEVIRVPVALAAAEQQRYEEYGRLIRDFISARRQERPLFQWEDVLREANRDPEARRVKMAFFARQKIENEALEKFRILEDLFRLHRGERVIVFAGSNPMAIKISRRFLIPTLLAHSRKRERAEVLAGFAAGTFPALVANRVLDEGVDVPAAKVAVVVGGLGSTRQAKQRLGRILRPIGGIPAVLYEVVTETAPEQARSRKRRASDAFERTRHRRL
jgi:superfamily II DNA or RNA helicase